MTRYALQLTLQDLEIVIDVNRAALSKKIAAELLNRTDDADSRRRDADGDSVAAAIKLIGAACMDQVARGHRGGNWITRTVTRDMALPQGLFRVVEIKGHIAIDSRDLDLEEAA